MARIEPSAELAAVARRWLRAYGQGDVETVTHLLSDDETLRYVGTAQNEYWDRDSIRDAFRGYAEAIPQFDWSDEKVEAFATQDVGWAAWQGLCHFSTGKSVTIRTTMVFKLERGVWRIVHLHNSLPQPTLDVMGYEVGFDDLLEAARTADEGLPQTGLATIMFTDIADSTTLAETLGDMRWSAAVKSHIGAVRERIEARDGTLIKSLGDGTMSSFASARAALTAAADLQRAMDASDTEPRLQIRIGLHTGDLIAGDDDVFGTVVNKAARIAATAAPGEIRLSDATKIMVGGGEFRFGAPMALPLKGLEGDHTLYRLEWRP